MAYEIENQFAKYYQDFCDAAQKNIWMQFLNVPKVTEEQNITISENEIYDHFVSLSRHVSSLCGGYVSLFELHFTGEGQGGPWHFGPPGLCPVGPFIIPSIGPQS